MEEQHKERKASYKLLVPTRMSSKISVSAGCLRRAGLEHNRSRFIVKESSPKPRVAWCVSTRPYRYVTRLNQFTSRLQRVGNNYNQIVRAVNAFFAYGDSATSASSGAPPRELKALSEQVIALSRELTSYGRADTGIIPDQLSSSYPSRQNDYLCEGKAVLIPDKRPER